LFVENACVLVKRLSILWKSPSLVEQAPHLLRKPLFSCERAHLWSVSS
jgi:hypothetical protein